MAAVAISGAAEAVGETGKEAIKTAQDVQKYSYGVMKRDFPTYDYEKVFWNSTYTVGLFGLAWASVKLGQLIKSVSITIKGIADYVANPVGTTDVNLFNVIYDYVEGEKSDPVKYPLGGFDFWGMLGASWGFGLLTGSSFDYIAKSTANRYREHPDEYKVYKDAFMLKHPDLFDASGKYVKGGRAQEVVGDILDYADRFFTEYGPIVPVAAVMGHMSLEGIRVHRLRWKLKD